MTAPEQTNHHNEQIPEALFPPGYLLLISAAGFLFAFGVLMTQQTFGVVGFGGLGIGLLGLIAWGLMAPEQLGDVLKGRALQYGGTAVLITVLFFAALTMIYIVVREQNWRTDVSNQEIFSLTDEARALVTTLAADPTLPPARIIGFFSSVQAGQRDRVEVLLQDVESAARGRIDYQFIDPDRNPQLLELYGATPGQLVVVALDENGDPDLESAELLTSSDQQVITDALIKVTAGGNFQMLVLSVEDGATVDDATGVGIAILANSMADRFSWDVQQTLLFDLEGDDSPLANPAVDGTVVVIPGGSAALPDESLNILTDYLDNGGDLVLYAGISLDGGEALAVAENLSTYLYENFGVRFQDSFVFDPTRVISSVFDVIVDNYGDHPIVSAYQPETSIIVYEAARPIEIAETLPENVIISVLTTTEDTAYIKDDLNLTAELTEDDLLQNDSDVAGSFPLAVAVENTATGARLVLMGSTSMYQNVYQQLQAAGVNNLLMSQDSLLWAADYDSFQTVRSQVLPRNTPVPVIASPEEIQLINSISTIFLPFGVLLIGVAVWWMNRERERA